MIYSVLVDQSIALLSPLGEFESKDDLLRYIGGGGGGVDGKSWVLYPILSNLAEFIQDTKCGGCRSARTMADIIQSAARPDLIVKENMDKTPESIFEDIVTGVLERHRRAIALPSGDTLGGIFLHYLYTEASEVKWDPQQSPLVSLKNMYDEFKQRFNPFFPLISQNFNLAMNPEETNVLWGSTASTEQIEFTIYVRAMSRFMRNGNAAGAIDDDDFDKMVNVFPSSLQKHGETEDSLMSLLVPGDWVKNSEYENAQKWMDWVFQKTVGPTANSSEDDYKKLTDLIDAALQFNKNQQRQQTTGSSLQAGSNLRASAPPFRPANGRK